MNQKIPIYRAKKIDSDEYVIGWYSSPIIIEGKLYLSITNRDGEHRIDTTTLSIHFPDMMDSQGNKIFASLQEDGKGGDICEFKDWDRYYEDEFLNKGICLYENLKIVFTNRYKIMMEDLEFKYDVKVIGIQE